MRKIIMKDSRFWASLFCVVLILSAGVYADYRSGASTLLDSTYTGSDANTGVHTPIISTVAGSSAGVVNSLFTSGTAALAFDTASSITTAFDLVGVRFLSSAVSSTQSLTVQMNSGSGAEFNVSFYSDTMATTSSVFRPTVPISFRLIDAAAVAYPNANSDTIGLEFLYVTP